MNDVVRRKSAGPDAGGAKPAHGLAAFAPYNLKRKYRCRPAADAAGRRIASNQKAQDSILLNWAYLQDCLTASFAGVAGFLAESIGPPSAKWGPNTSPSLSIAIKLCPEESTPTTRRTGMDFGALMFFTDYAISAVDLAKAFEERGFESVWAPEHSHIRPEHSHIPTSRKTPFPGGGELPKRYYDAMDPFVSLTAAAVVTTKLKVGTGVCLVQQRDPI
jgi:luciferase-like monooxygenase